MSFDEEEYKRDQLRIRHHAARFARKHRYERTPKLGITWPRWFRDKFGMTLYEYEEWLKDHNQKLADLAQKNAVSPEDKGKGDSENQNDH